MDERQPVLSCEHGLRADDLNVAGRVRRLVDGRFFRLFLLDDLGYVSAATVGIVWPILLIALGLKKMCGGMCKCCAKG